MYYFVKTNAPATARLHRVVAGVAGWNGISTNFKYDALSPPSASLPAYPA